MQQQELFKKETFPLISLEEIFQAYYACRQNKRKTINALKFEMNLEENLVQLWREINNGEYELGRSIAFIVKKPVIREIFAANFRDRIVHHLIINKLEYLFKLAISQHSYSCAKGKGGLYGIKKIYEYVKKCSHNYQKDAYVLRLDIRAFFMHINHHILYKMLKEMMAHYHHADKQLILSILKKIVYNCPQKTCFKKGSFQDWAKLPKAKSLFCVGKNRGLPIGNFTSQIFANFYLNQLDRFIQSCPGIYYGRYVDDMVLVHENKAELLKLLPKIKSFLKINCGLILHPKKISLQHYKKGFAFIGAYFLKNRIYAGKRLKNMFLTKIKNQKGKDKEKVLNIINSYFGFLRHFHTNKLRIKGFFILKQDCPELGLCYNNLKIVRIKTKEELIALKLLRKKKNWRYMEKKYNQNNLWASMFFLHNIGFT